MEISNIALGFRVLGLAYIYGLCRDFYGFYGDFEHCINTREGPKQR